MVGTIVVCEAEKVDDSVFELHEDTFGGQELIVVCQGPRVDADAGSEYIQVLGRSRY